MHNPALSPLFIVLSIHHEVSILSPYFILIYFLYAFLAYVWGYNLVCVSSIFIHVALWAVPRCFPSMLCESFTEACGFSESDRIPLRSWEETEGPDLNAEISDSMKDNGLGVVGTKVGNYKPLESDSGGGLSSSGEAEPTREIMSIKTAGSSQDPAYPSCH